MSQTDADLPGSGAASGVAAGPRPWVFIAVVGAPLFWASNFLISEQVLAEISSLWISLLRWLIGIVLLVPLALLIEKPRWRVALREWPLHLAAGAAGPALYTVVNYDAIDAASGIDIALITGAAPAVIVLGAALVLRERVRFVTVAGIVISLVGVVVLVTRGDLTQLASLGDNVGELLGVLSVLVWTVYTLLNRRVRTPPITATAIQAVVGAALIAPFVAIENTPLALSSNGWLQVVLIAIFPGVAAFVLWNLGVQRLGPARSGIFLNLIPVFTVGFGVLLGGSVAWQQLVGGAIVIAGVVLTTRPRRAVG